MWHATAAASRKRSRKWATSLNGSTKFCKPILPGIALVLTLHLALTLAAVAVSRVLCFIFAFAFLHLHLHVWHASANASEYATFCLPFVAALLFRMHSSGSTYIHTHACKQRNTHTFKHITITQLGQQEQFPLLSVRSRFCIHCFGLFPKNKRTLHNIQRICHTFADYIPPTSKTN